MSRRGASAGPCCSCSKKTGTCGACSCNRDGRCCFNCYPGQVGRCKNFGNCDLHDVGGSEVPQGLSAGDPPAWSGRRVQPSRSGKSAAGRTGGVPREVRATLVSRPPSSAAERSGAAPAPEVAGSSQSSVSATAVPCGESLRVDLPVPVCSGMVPDCAAAPSPVGASADPTAASRVPASAAPTSVGPGSSRQPQFVDLPPEKCDSPEPDGFWSLPTDDIIILMDKTHAEIVKWQRNLFIIPFGDEGRRFVKELARLIGLFSGGTRDGAFAWSAVVIACHLILQRPFVVSNASDNKKSLRKRLDWWMCGDMAALLREARCIQAHLPRSTPGKTAANGLDDVEFAKMVYSDRIGTAAHYLEDDGGGGVLPLDKIVGGKSVLELLRDKHPVPADAEPEILLDDEATVQENVLFDSITPAQIRKTCMIMKGAAGPSGLDSAAWRRMASMYTSASDDLCSALARAAKRLCTEAIEPRDLRSFLAARLIPLDKQPGVRPIAIGEVFRRVIGKVVMSVIERDVAAVTAPHQLCVGVPSACEVGVQALTGLYDRETTQGILLVDASNAFNSLNRAAALHNIPRICPAAGRIFINTYQADIPLYLNGGEVIYSREGTCQGDPLAMAFYALATVPLASRLSRRLPSTSQIWYADDDAAAGELLPLRGYWDCIVEEGPRYGYHPNAMKTVLLVRPHLMERAQEVFAGTDVRIRSDGVRYLGGAIGDQQFRENFVKSRVEELSTLVRRLAGLAVTQPQAAFRVFSASLQSRWTYLQRAVFVDPVLYTPLDDVINKHLLPALTGHPLAADGVLRQLFAMPVRNGGLAVRIGSLRAEAEYLLCRTSIMPMVDCVLTGAVDGPDAIDGPVADIIAASRGLATQARRERRAQHNAALEEIRPALTDEQRLLVDVAGDGGVSTWLVTPPSASFPLTIFNKSDFRDALCLRYGLPLDGISLSCVCGQDMSVHHALTCPSGGYPTQRHNELRDLLADALASVVCDVEIEPPLMPLGGEAVSGGSADGARVDIRARGFWTRQQNAFFDVRVTHPRPSLLSGPEVSRQLSQHERQKKRQYSDRINQVDRGSFTPLVFATSGQCAPECGIFLKTLATQLHHKNSDIPYRLIISHLRSRISLSLMRWQITCFRGSRASYLRSGSGIGRHCFVTECRTLAHMPR